MKSPRRTYYANFRLPEGLLGRYVVHRMNGKRHGALAEWALKEVQLNSNASIADIGCGGGANVARMLDQFPDSKVAGVDFSPVAINMALRVNKEAIAAGRCKIVGGNAKLLPLLKETYDLIIGPHSVNASPRFTAYSNLAVRSSSPMRPTALTPKGINGPDLSATCASTLLRNLLSISPRPASPTSSHATMKSATSSALQAQSHKKGPYG